MFLLENNNMSTNVTMHELGIVHTIVTIHYIPFTIHNIVTIDIMLYSLWRVRDNPIWGPWLILVFSSF